MAGDSTSKATAAALEKAKEVMRNGGTQAEAAAAAKEVARQVLTESGGLGDRYLSLPSSTASTASPGTMGTTGTATGALLAFKMKKMNLTRPPLSPSGGGGGLLSKLRKKSEGRWRNKKRAAAPEPVLEEEEESAEGRDEVESSANSSNGTEPITSHLREQETHAVMMHNAIEEEPWMSPTRGRSSSPRSSSAYPTEGNNNKPSQGTDQQSAYDDGMVYYRGNMPSIYIKDRDESVSLLSREEMGKDSASIMDILFLNHVMNAVDKVIFPVDGNTGSTGNNKAASSSGKSSSQGMNNFKDPDEEIEYQRFGWWTHRWNQFCCGESLPSQDNSSVIRSKDGDSLRESRFFGTQNGRSGAANNNDLSVNDDGQYYSKSKRITANAMVVAGGVSNAGNHNIQVVKSVSWSESLDDNRDVLNLNQSTNTNSVTNSNSVDDSSLIKAMARGMANGSQASFSSSALRRKRWGGGVGNSRGTFETNIVQQLILYYYKKTLSWFCRQNSIYGRWVISMEKYIFGELIYFGSTT